MSIQTTAYRANPRCQQFEAERNAIGLVFEDRKAKTPAEYEHARAEYEAQMNEARSRLDADLAEGGLVLVEEWREAGFTYDVVPIGERVEAVQ